MGAAALVPDRLWELIEPLLPAPVPKPSSGIAWQMLPKELGCGAGMSCWRRFRDWQEAGLWDLIHFALLDWLSREHHIEPYRARRHPPPPRIRRPGNSWDLAHPRFGSHSAAHSVLRQARSKRDRRSFAGAASAFTPPLASIHALIHAAERERSRFALTRSAC